MKTMLKFFANSGVYQAPPKFFLYAAVALIIIGAIFGTALRWRGYVIERLWNFQSDDPKMMRMRKWMIAALLMLVGGLVLTVWSLMASVGR